MRSGPWAWEFAESLSILGAAGAGGGGGRLPGEDQQDC